MFRSLTHLMSAIIAILFTLSLHAQDAGPTDLREGDIFVGGKIYTNLQEAFDAVPKFGIIRIGPGVFKQAAVLAKGKDNVLITGSAGTVLDGVAAQAKGALVIAANDITIKNLACRNIAVRDHNGACVRFEGDNLILRHVHFYNNENGLLTTKQTKSVLIEDSVFENNGKAGRAHGMYINGGSLTVRRSKILSSKDEGHEIKSRGPRLLIENCIIASLEGNDSRLIDIPDGGIAIIRNNLLVEGPNTVNWELLSFGVEKQPYHDNGLRIEKNVIVTDREGGSQLIGIHPSMPTPIVRNNLVVGRIVYDWPVNNFFYEDREELGWPAAPTLPDWDPAK